MKRKVFVAGVGMIPFSKPGRSDPYTVMGERAARLALDDARVPYSEVQQAYVSYVYGDSTAGQAAIYRVGLTGIPVFNLNNNCSSGRAHCSWHAKRSRAGWSNAPSRWASSRWCLARSRAPIPTGRRRWNALPNQ
jgi:acetyl-CoA acetyltransferase